MTNKTSYQEKDEKNLQNFSQNSQDIRSNEYSLIALKIKKISKHKLQNLSYILGVSKDEIVESLIENVYTYNKNLKINGNNVHIPFSNLINSTVIEKIFGKKIKNYINKNVKPAFCVGQKKKYLKKDIIEYLSKTFDFSEEKLYEMLNLPDKSNDHDFLLKSELSEYMQISPYKVNLLQKKGIIKETKKNMYKRKDIDMVIEKIIKGEIKL